MRLVLISALCILTLSACGGKDRGLRDFRTNKAGPDEFSVAPTKPLETPSSYSELPSPTPGGSNLTDATPNSDAIAALGGNAAAASRGGIPTTDRALVAHAGRKGITPDIRNVLAAEDETFRKRRGRIGFLGRGDKYFAAYATQALDAFAELVRWRQLGVKTPSAPPSN